MKFQPDNKGPQHNPLSTNPETNPVFVQQTDSSSLIHKEGDIFKEKCDVISKIIDMDAKSKHKKKEEKDKLFVSEEFQQCPDPFERKKPNFVDVDNIMKSCLDLAIDG